MRQSTTMGFPNTAIAYHHSVLSSLHARRVRGPRREGLLARSEHDQSCHISGYSPKAGQGYGYNECTPEVVTEYSTFSDQPSGQCETFVESTVEGMGLELALGIDCSYKGRPWPRIGPLGRCSTSSIQQIFQKKALSTLTKHVFCAIIVPVSTNTQM